MLKIAICDDNAIQLDIIQEELKKNIKEDISYTMVCAPSSRQLKKYRFFATQIMLGSIFMLP